MNSFPVEGERQQRQTGLEVVNASGKHIAELESNIHYVDAEGAVARTVPHTVSWTPGEPAGAFGRMISY